jgi:hypothetical protein
MSKIPSGTESAQLKFSKGDAITTVDVVRIGSDSENLKLSICCPLFPRLRTSAAARGPSQFTVIRTGIGFRRGFAAVGRGGRMLSQRDFGAL